VAHDGVATQTEGLCTTYSIGFRAPTHQEIADGFLDWIGATSELDGRLEDPDLTATANPARVPKIYQREIFAAIEKLQMDRSAIKQFAGCFATDVKPQIVFDAPDEPLLRAAFSRVASSKGVAFSAATICLYDDEFLFINGEAFVIKGDAIFWRAFADERHALVSVKQAVETVDALYAWYCDGWLQLRP
jgi:50S ribosomal protein L16 3-hydroxylase